MTKTVAKICGVLFLLAGILGFFANPLIGPSGYFMTNAAHNIIHLILGALLLLASGTDKKAAFWMKLVGIAYLVIALLGFLAIPATKMSANLLGFVQVNGSDNWLHLVLGLVVFLCGFVGENPTSETGTH